MKQVTLPQCEVCRNRHHPGECYYMKKYVQTPKNLYCTFCKSIGHDDRDCRAYDLMHERSRDIYKIQGEVQQEGNTTQYNSHGRGNFNPHSGFRGKDEEEEWVEAVEKSSVITVHNQDTSQWIVRTLVPLASTATCLNML